MNDRFLGRSRSTLIASAVSWGIMLIAAQAQSAASDASTGKARFALTSPDIANGGNISEAQVFNAFGSLPAYAVFCGVSMCERLAPAQYPFGNRAGCLGRGADASEFAGRSRQTTDEPVRGSPMAS